jgi:photosystem II stability/assembly factor-like uncharacterized protein
MRHHLLPSICPALLGVFLSTAPLSAVAGQWHALGPDGGSVYDLVLQPGDPRVMYAAVSGGVFKSMDGGASWAWSGAGLDAGSSVLKLAIDPVRPATMYAVQGSGLFKSVNGGRTWRYARVSTAFAVAAHPRAAGAVFAASELGLLRSLDSGITWRRLAPRPRPIRATLILFDPTSSKRLYASLQEPDSGEGGLFRSLDGGVTWRPIHGGPLNRQRVFALAVAPRSPQTLYAATATAVFKSTIGGATWKRTGLTGAGFVQTLAAHPRHRDVVYAGTDSGLFRSLDGGATWTRLVQGLPQPGGGFAFAFHPSSSTLYASVVTSFEQGGVFKSTDEGRSWTLSSRGFSVLAVVSLAVGAQDSATLWAVGNAVPFKSTDRGQTWVRVRPNPDAGDVRATRIAVDPVDPATVYILFADGGLQRTHDGGQTWEVAANPGVAPFGNAALVIDPQTPSTLYIAGVGIAKSTDGGSTWTHLSGDPADMVFFDLEISPTSPSTLYGTGGGVGGARVVRSTDGGATWTRIQQDLPRLVPDLAVDPLVATTLYAVAEGVVYQTSDGGATWPVFSGAFQDRTLLALVISPSPSGLLYAPVWFDNVYQTRDGGAAWDPLGRSPFETGYWTLAEAPVDPCRLYVGTTNRGLLAFEKDDC